MTLKLQFMSDLHLEFHRDGGKSLIDTFKPQGDILVLAGDILVVSQYENAAKLAEPFKRLADLGMPMVYVSGNHEHYTGSFALVDRMLQEVEPLVEGLHVLRTGQPVTVKGQRFLGDTMWFREEPTSTYYQSYMNDFRIIRKFKPEVYDRNLRFRRYLKEQLAEGDVVVTHHLPTSLSTPEEFKDSPLNPFYVCDVSGIILSKNPKLWIHGHTHKACDYMVGDTRVVCAPVGYPHEPNFLTYQCGLVEI